MGAVEVQWVQFRMRSGTPLSRWQAHLVKPFQSREFAWLVRRNGAWHLDVMLGATHVRQVAIYPCREPGAAMRHLERWIAARGRWEKLVLARGAEDPRGKYDRFAPSARKHFMAVQLREFYRFNPTRPGPMPGQGELPRMPAPSATIEEELDALWSRSAATR